MIGSGIEGVRPSKEKKKGELHSGSVVTDGSRRTEPDGGDQD